MKPLLLVAYHYLPARAESVGVRRLERAPFPVALTVRVTGGTQLSSEEVVRISPMGPRTLARLIDKGRFQEVVPRSAGTSTFGFYKPFHPPVGSPVVPAQPAAEGSDA